MFCMGTIMALYFGMYMGIRSWFEPVPEASGFFMWVGVGILIVGASFLDSGWKMGSYGENDEPRDNVAGCMTIIVMLLLLWGLSIKDLNMFFWIVIIVFVLTTLSGITAVTKVLKGYIFFFSTILAILCFYYVFFVVNLPLWMTLVAISLVAGVPILLLGLYLAV